MFGFLLHLRRRPVVWCLLTLALAAAAASALIGLNAWTVVRQQSSELSDTYVTIAIPLTKKYISRELAEIKFNAAMKSGCVEEVDRRCLLGAEVKGSRALTSGALDRLSYDSPYDGDSYTTAVMTVTCENVVEQEYYRVFAEEFDPGAYPYVEYTVEASVKEVVSLADAYVRPNRGDLVKLEFGTYLEDGTIPFEIGKTYIVFGTFWDYPIEYVYEPNEDPVTGKFGYLVELKPDSSCGYNLILSDALLDENVMTDEDWQEIQALCQSVEEQYRDYPDPYGMHYSRTNVTDWTVRGTYDNGNGLDYYYALPGGLPHWSECPGTAAEFLAGDEGKVWREQILPMCEVNHRSASVILTNNLQSMYSFNNGVASIQEGRDFTKEDYENGSDVCIIGADYAAYNGYRLGDKITLDFYNTVNASAGVAPRGMAVGESGASVRYEIATHGVCTERNRIGVCKEYEIVGIYSAPAFQAETVQSFQGDTIFVPKASVPNSEQYEAPEYELLQSIILKNGTQEQFMQYLKDYRDYTEEEALQYFDGQDSVDLSEHFLCFDQQYDKAEGSVEAMRENARRLLLISLAAFAVVLAAEQYFSYRRMRQTALTMRRLGVDRRRIRREAFAAFLLPDGIAAVLGAVLARLLFTRLTAYAEVETVGLELLPLILSAVGVFAVTAAISALCALRLSRLALMQKK